MNDYDEEALVARSRCNHTLGRNEEAIEDGKCLTNYFFARNYQLNEEAIEDGKCLTNYFFARNYQLNEEAIEDGKHF